MPTASLPSNRRRRPDRSTGRRPLWQARTAQSPPSITGPSRSGYADVNGLHLYFEIYGTGTPLVLPHGGMMTIDLSFASLIPALSDSHEVIGVELRGHASTRSRTRRARNALARVAQHGTPAEQKKVRSAVHKRFPSIGKKMSKNP